MAKDLYISALLDVYGEFSSGTVKYKFSLKDGLLNFNKENEEGTFQRAIRWRSISLPPSGGTTCSCRSPSPKPCPPLREPRHTR